MLSVTAMRFVLETSYFLNEIRKVSKGLHCIPFHTNKLLFRLLFDEILSCVKRIVCFRMSVEW